MNDASPADVTQILREWSAGDNDAPARLMPLVYAELRRLARKHLRQERAEHTLQPTALVHEAYLRLVDQTRVDWQNRAQFFGVAAQIMRRILVDHARTRAADKRGGQASRLSLDEAHFVPEEREADLLELDAALCRLAEVDERKSKVVVLRFFGGLNADEVAKVLSVHPATVRRDWIVAKAWLHREIDRSRMS